MRGTDNGRGSNTKHSAALISNGSKIVVPQGFGLITMANTLSGSRGRNFIRQSKAGGGFNRQDSPDALEQLRKAKKCLTRS